MFFEQTVLENVLIVYVVIILHKLLVLHDTMQAAQNGRIDVEYVTVLCANQQQHHVLRVHVRALKRRHVEQHLLALLL